MDDRELGRLILLITSQSDRDDLEFIPPVRWARGTPLTMETRLPVDLYHQFLDPEAGACDPVPDLEGVASEHLIDAQSSLVINPTLDAAQKILAHAFAQAEKRQRVLIIHYVGHGFRTRLAEADPWSHRLLLVDTPSDERAWNPYAEAEQLIKRHQLPGFVFLVDACQASSARPEIARWGTSPTTYVWMGASQDTAAFDGCFSTALLDTMCHGDRTLPGLRPMAEVHSRHFREIVDKSCHKPEDSKYPKADDVTSKADDYVFITRNRAVEAYESDLGLAGSTRDRLRSAVGEHYQIIDVEAINKALRDHPFVVVTGGAGSGKTALCGVLRERPDRLDARRLDAITFLDARSGLDEIAEAFHPQLAKSQHYADLIERYERTTADLDKQGPHQRYITGPFGQVQDLDPFVVGLDGLDQLSVDRQSVVLDEYRRLVEAGCFRVLATSRPESSGGPIPSHATSISMPPVSEALARRYMSERGVVLPELQQRVIGLGEDLNWLVVSLAVDQVLADPDEPLAADETALYRGLVADAEQDLGAQPVRCALDVLVASGQVAGVGPKLPFAVFVAAVAKLGGPSTVLDVNNLLGHERLYRVVERANPATDEERLGLFHLTAIDALTPGAERCQAAHRAIVEVLDTHTPTAGP